MGVYDHVDDIPQVNVNGRKMKLLEVMRIIEEETDQEHTLTAQEIVQRLKKKGFDHADRKGVYDDINVLNLFFRPRDERKKSKAKRIEKDEQTWGYYLDNRPFSVSEIKLIIDAVLSSKFLSESKTEELVEKLQSLCTKEDAKGLRRQVIVSNRIKNMNTSVHNNVDHIHHAIDNDLQIRFKYFDYGIDKERVYRKKGNWYYASPLALVYAYDNYYLLAHYQKNETVTTFRVDRMAAISAIEVPREGKEILTKDEIALYQQYSFSMYNGKKERVTLRIHRTMMNVVIDRFGRQVWAKKVDDDHFEVTVTVFVSNQFYGWVFGLKNYVTIMGPQWVRDGMKDMLKAVEKRYAE